MSDTMKITIFDALTGETVEREMSEQEQEDFATDEALALANKVD